MRIEIDEKTRLIPATAFKLGKAGRIDFARDKVLVLDGQNRPVAFITPIAGAAAGAAPAPNAVEKAPGRPEDEPEAVGSGETQAGPLTLAQREAINRLWTREPHRSPQYIASEFARLHGRSISEVTATKYAPSDVKDRLAKA